MKQKSYLISEMHSLDSLWPHISNMQCSGLLLTLFPTVGHLTAKSDVYSFGVVLLEMLSGRRALDKNRPSGEHNLVEWARPYLTNKRKIFRILDSRLEGQYSLDAAFRVSTLAFQCLSAEPKFRPTMAEVVTELEQLQESSRATGNTRTSSGTGRRSRRRSADDNSSRSNAKLKSVASDPRV